MLNYKEFLGLAGMLAPTTTIALVALWRHPHLWRLSFGILATTAGILFYLPVRLTFFRAAGSDGFDGFGFFAEFIVLGGVLGTWNLVLTSMILLLVLEGWLEQRLAERYARAAKKDQFGPGTALELEIDANDTRKFPPPSPGGL